MCPLHVVTCWDTGLIYTWLRSISTERPGALQEVMLHETAVAWCRYKLARCLPARPWLETPEEYRTRLKAAVAEVSATHDVESLCKELPARVAQLSLAEGGRLAK